MKWTGEIEIKIKGNRCEMYCLVKARTDIDEAQKLSFAIEEGFKLWDFFTSNRRHAHAVL